MLARAWLASRSDYIILHNTTIAFCKKKCSGDVGWSTTRWFLCNGWVSVLTATMPHAGGLCPLLWRHNEPNGVSNHQAHDCLLNRLFGHRSKKTSKLRVTGLCVGNSPGTGEFPAQVASNAENVSMWWRHHALLYRMYTWTRHKSTIISQNPTGIRPIWTTSFRFWLVILCLHNLSRHAPFSLCECLYKWIVYIVLFYILICYVLFWYICFWFCNIP